MHLSVNAGQDAQTASSYIAYTIGREHISVYLHSFELTIRGQTSLAPRWLHRCPKGRFFHRKKVDFPSKYSQASIFKDD